MSDDTRKSAGYGPNVWLIDEMYKEFKEHPEALSESWRDFFSDYEPAAPRRAPASPGRRLVMAH